MPSPLSNVSAFCGAKQTWSGEGECFTSGHNSSAGELERDCSLVLQTCLAGLTKSSWHSSIVQCSDTCQRWTKSHCHPYEIWKLASWWSPCGVGFPFRKRTVVFCFPSWGWLSWKKNIGCTTWARQNLRISCVNGQLEVAALPELSGLIGLSEASGTAVAYTQPGTS